VRDGVTRSEVVSGQAAAAKRLNGMSVDEAARTVEAAPREPNMDTVSGVAPEARARAAGVPVTGC
jgi:hypothetical protein